MNRNKQCHLPQKHPSRFTPGGLFPLQTNIRGFLFCRCLRLPFIPVCLFCKGRLLFLIFPKIQTPFQKQQTKGIQRHSTGKFVKIQYERRCQKHHTDRSPPKTCLGKYPVMEPPKSRKPDPHSYKTAKPQNKITIGSLQDKRRAQKSEIAGGQHCQK